jgi:hypothetical protein
VIFRPTQQHASAERTIEGASVPTRAFIAEQTSRNRYSRVAPLPPREIELTLRLEIPEESGADVSTTPDLDLPLPTSWEETVHQRLYAGVHGGIARGGAPLPAGGIGVHITRLRVTPLFDGEDNPNERRRLGETLEALTASTVAALWAGLISHGAPTAA